MQALFYHLDHVTVSFARSGGPGGQNVNKGLWNLSSKQIKEWRLTYCDDLGFLISTFPSICQRLCILFRYIFDLQ